MSQKTARRSSRRHTTETQDINMDKLSGKETSTADIKSTKEETKCITPVPNAIENISNQETESLTPKSDIVTNGSETAQSDETNQNGCVGEESVEITPNQEVVTVDPEEKSPKPQETVSPAVNPVEADTKDEEMDPLVICNESDPELVFEESPDTENDYEFPVESRCKTRRSLTRNIPTPSTPNDQLDPADIPVEIELNSTFDSCENASTKVEVGGDSTRLNYTDTLQDPPANSFLRVAKGKSFGEALRTLSTRRSIRPLGYSYERISGGEKSTLKRKCVEEHDGSGKKRKGDASPGLLCSKWISPLREVFGIQDVVSSTPKLTGYKDKNVLIEGDLQNGKAEEAEKRWCVVM